MASVIFTYRDRGGDMRFVRARNCPDPEAARSMLELWMELRVIVQYEAAQ